VWEKIKEFFKKYWGYIASFVLGALAYISIDSRRDKRIARNIQELRDQLGHYKQINQQFADRIAELTEQLANITDTSDEARTNHQSIAGEIEHARENAEQIGQRIDKALDHARNVDTITDELSRESTELTGAINKLGAFLEKYGAQTKTD
jgi:methyl-accepting chemotaxis protein